MIFNYYSSVIIVAYKMYTILTVLCLAGGICFLHKTNYQITSM